jgi:hypothetical protein
MKCSAAALALCVLGYAADPAAAQKGGKGDQEAVRQGWIFSLEEGKTQARKTGKPLMVVVRCVP